MQCRIADLRCKEVINICDGLRMGYVDDVLLDTACGKILAIVVFGPCKILGLFGRTEDYIINWDKIVRIGDDIVLVEVKGEHNRVKHDRRLHL